MKAGKVIKVSLSAVVALFFMLALAGMLLPKIFPGDMHAVARSDILSIQETCNLFRLHTGQYPKESEGLSALLRSPPHTNEPYLSQIPLDPWNKPYRYSIVDGKPEIRSAGPDSKLHTEDDITK